MVEDELATMKLEYKTTQQAHNTTKEELMKLKEAFEGTVLFYFINGNPT